MTELSAFNRKRLRSVSEKEKLASKNYEKSLKEKLNDELLKFDHSKLRPVNVIEKKFPNMVLQGMKRLIRPNDELVFQLSLPKESKSCQTELIDGLKGWLAIPPRRMSRSETHRRNDSTNDSGFVSPASDHSSRSTPSTSPSSTNNLLTEDKWKLVEEKVCRIRTITTEYF